MVHHEQKDDRTFSLDSSSRPYHTLDTSNSTGSQHWEIKFVVDFLQKL